MYEDFYGFREKPFNLTPDPSFLYLSENHKEAFAHLLYGIRNRSGFVMVTGEIGTGKTTICRSLLSKLDPDTEVAFIFNPVLSAEELLRKINEDFGIDSQAETIKGLIDELNGYLLERASLGINCVLVIDEAQNLDPKVLEQVRLLSNLETETQKLLQIVLIGQPELAHMLAQTELRQLNQRITARYHLKELNPEETLHYIAFRLRVAGGIRKVRFSRAAVMKVHRYSKGTPRVINALSDRALLIGYTQETREITPKMIKQAIKETQGEKIVQKKPKTERRPLVSPATLAFAAIILVILAATFPAPLTVLRDSGQVLGTAWNMVSSGEATIGEPSQASATVDDADPVSLASLHHEALISPEENPIHVTDPAYDGMTSDEFRQTLAALPPDEAFRGSIAALFQTWGHETSAEDTRVVNETTLAVFAREQGFSLLRLTPTFEQLATINLPVCIILNDVAGPRMCALLGIDGDYVSVAVGQDDPIPLSRTIISDRYAGQALYCWIDPNPTAPIVKPWQENKHVLAFQEQLQKCDLLDQEPNKAFDRKTIDLVKRIQQSAGLMVDGVVGVQTRMVLNSWDATSGSPNLVEESLPMAVRLRVLEEHTVTTAARPRPNTVRPEHHARREVTTTPNISVAPEVAPEALNSESFSPEDATPAEEIAEVVAEQVAPSPDALPEAIDAALLASEEADDVSEGAEENTVAMAEVSVIQDLGQPIREPVLIPMASDVEKMLTKPSVAPVPLLPRDATETEAQDVDAS